MGICETKPSSSRSDLPTPLADASFKLSHIPDNSQQVPTTPSNMMSTSAKKQTKIPMSNDADSIITRLVMILSSYYHRLQHGDSQTLQHLSWSHFFDGKNKHSKNYTDVSLVNDFNFLLDNNNGDADIQRIQQQLLLSIHDTQGVLNDFEEGSILYRHLVVDHWTLSTKQQWSELYFGCTDRRTLIRYRLLDKMFVHCMYGHLLGLRLTNSELHAIQNTAAANNSEHKHDAEPELDLALSKMNEILFAKRALWHKLKSEQWMSRFADTKFMTNVAKLSEHSDRTAAESLVEGYSIGRRYYYDSWTYYAENQRKLNLDDACMIRGAHFPSLKQEMVRLNRMTMDEWQFMQEMCALLFASAKCKALKCDVLKSDGHGIDMHYGFNQGEHTHTLEHVFCVYIYCNCPAIKQAFQTEIASNKFAHFGRLLREMVEAFGISVFRDDSEPFFYHNVSTASDAQADDDIKKDEENASPVCFNGHLALKWCSPTLMTSSSNIIHLYSMMDADQPHTLVTLTLCKHSTFASSVNYFACNWLSDCSLDNECLFIGGKYALTLQSIVCRHMYNYTHYLTGIHVLSSLIKGKANMLRIDAKLLFAIETLTETKLNVHSGDRNESRRNQHNTKNGTAYVMRIFEKFCENVTTPIYINLIWVLDTSANGYAAIKQWITNDDHSWIRFDVLCTLFPNVEKVKIGHSQFNLQPATFDAFMEFFGQPQVRDHSKLKEIVIEDPNESLVSVQCIINAYQSKLETIDWVMDSNKFNTKIILSKQEKHKSNLWDDLF